MIRIHFSTRYQRAVDAARRLRACLGPTAPGWERVITMQDSFETALRGAVPSQVARTIIPRQGLADVEILVEAAMVNSANCSTLAGVAPPTIPGTAVVLEFRLATRRERASQCPTPPTSPSGESR